MNAGVFLQRNHLRSNRPTADVGGAERKQAQACPVVASPPGAGGTRLCGGEVRAEAALEGGHGLAWKGALGLPGCPSCLCLGGG